MQRSASLSIVQYASEQGAGLLHAFRSGFQANRMLYTLSLTTLFAAFATSLVTGAKMDVSLVFILSLPGLISYGLFIVVMALAELVRLARSGHQGPVIPVLARMIARDYLAPQCLINLVHTLLILTPFMMAFSFFKTAIPTINPFSWDISLSETDRILHFGTYPYEWLAPALNVPQITTFLNINYQLWFLIVVAMWLWQGAAPKESYLRQRYLTSFIIMWFIGTSVLGTFFSSVGPCYYGKLLPAEVDPYAPLMAYLIEANKVSPVHSLGLMDTLWNSYTAGEGFIGGISAMPSMHVASTVSFIFAAYAAGKPGLAKFFMLFSALIFLGSIHLGWHYAIDGYAAVLISWACWKIADPITRWDRNRRGVDDDGMPLSKVAKA